MKAEKIAPAFGITNYLFMYHTLGEIHRKGLMLTFTGKPYKSRASLSQVVKHLQFTMIDTPWGKAKAISDEQIKAHNNKWKKLTRPI